MKKRTIFSLMILFSLFLFAEGLFAQGYALRDSIFLQEEFRLNLTQEQMKKIDALELELEKELDVLFSKLRSSWMRLEELEAQRNPESSELKKIWDTIYELENEAQDKEIWYQDEVKKVLTPEQRALLDPYEAVGWNLYGRGPIGGKNPVPGWGRYGGYTGYGPVMGRMRWGQRMNVLGAGYYGYGYGRGQGIGYGLNRGYSGLAAGRPDAGYTPYSGYYRYGRGPCGMGLGRWYRWGYGRGLWR
jgi:hypothetical protein